MIKLSEYFKATVTKVVKGKNGTYAVAISEQFDRITESKKFENSITFSLDNAVWQDEKKPNTGDQVKLGELRQTNQGWRSNKACFWKLSDEIAGKKINRKTEIRNQKKRRES